MTEGVEEVEVVVVVVVVDVVGDGSDEDEWEALEDVSNMFTVTSLTQGSAFTARLHKSAV